MRPTDFDNLRRNLKIMLLGQEITPIQAGELRDIIATRTVTHVDESGLYTREIHERAKRIQEQRA